MSTRRILVAGPAWVGDMVMTQSLLKALRQRHPDAELDVLAPAWCRPLVERMPEAHRGIDLPTRHGELGWFKRRALGHRLRADGYEQAIVLPRSAKAALVPWFARIPIRTGYVGEARYGLINDRRPLDRQQLPQTVQRFVALGLPAGTALPPTVAPPALRVDVEQRSALLSRLDLAPDARLVALLPGAEYGPAKQWPVAYFGGLARRLRAAGATPLVFGSAKERSLGAEIAGMAGDEVHNLCGQTTLVDVIDLLSACAAAISNDSGLMHVACATGIPVVAIYGSSTPAFTPPLSERAAWLDLELSCSPCFARHCPLGHTNCLKHISVDAVWRLLARTAPAVVQ